MGLAIDDTMLYMTGGLALGNIKDNAGVINTCCGNWNTAQSVTKAGWVAGAGIEHKLTQNLSLVGEFLYYDLGSYSKTSTASEESTTYQTQFQNQSDDCHSGNELALVASEPHQSLTARNPVPGRNLWLITLTPVPFGLWLACNSAPRPAGQ